ncbi:MAG TPA: inorganic phosphate transporter [Dermatophilaceae bacterium]|nr:inorganic phosphate transporter [Dermatophilaceae bacterium]
MEGALLAVILLGIAFDFSNGFHDSSNSIAALVATRAARPGPAVLMASIFTILGPIIVGTAVADTIGGLVSLGAEQTLIVLLAALVAGLVWNIATWYRGLPSSSSHALVGGLVGAGLVMAGPSAIVWGGFNGVFPYGVLGVLVGLAISPVLGAAVALAASVAMGRATRRASKELRTPVLRGEWVTAATLSFVHGANDAQKTMGLLTLALVAGGAIPSFIVPLWIKLACGLALTLGTALGGWRIVKTIGRRIYRLRPMDGLVSSGSSSVIIGFASLVGAPVSTTHVVSSSVVGVGASRRRRHVAWVVVRDILLAWVVTMPGCAVMAALVCAVARMVL